MLMKLILGLLWFLLHLAVSLVHLWRGTILYLKCCIISCGLLPKYRNLQLNKLRHLAIVIDAGEVKNTPKVKQLLSWLSDLGLKYVALYDMEGVLKKTFGLGVQDSTNQKEMETSMFIAQCQKKGMTIELLSFSDGKEGIAKAATVLCLSYFKDNATVNAKTEPKFSESDMTNALKAAGCGGPEPDLLLVYGPVRCHLGYPPWRLRYTEIVHMGRLKWMSYGGVLKAFYDFSKKHQNYGA